MAVGLFVSTMFSSRQPPTLQQIYPELFPSDDLSKEMEEQIRAEKSAANFIKFANSFNQRYMNNGNGKPQSENNG